MMKGEVGTNAPREAETGPVATVEQLFAQPSGDGFAQAGVWAATTDGSGVLVFRP